MERPELSNFPLTPGVYLYKNAKGRIIYVGKARRLRQRIASYFRDISKQTPKTSAMLRDAVSIDILCTNTEKEALLLEASLIKKHKPRYNIILRDDKSYLLFRIAYEHPFPRVEIVRRDLTKNKDRKARFFGPFSSGGAAKETWRLIHRFFPLRRCRDNAFANRTRPCLYYDMKQCMGPCVLPVDQNSYKEIIHKVVLLLSGRSRDLLRFLKQEMQDAADALLFEQAAIIRDQIKAVEKTIERQSVVFNTGVAIDLLGVAKTSDGMALGLAIVRDGLLLENRNFFWQGLEVEDTPELIIGFLTQFYLNRQGLGASIPPRIIVPWLAGNQTVPQDEDDAENSLYLFDTTTAPDVPDSLKSDAGDSKQPVATVSADQLVACTVFNNTEKRQSFNALTALEDAISEIKGAPVKISKPANSAEDQLILMAAATAVEAAKHERKEALCDILAKRFNTANALRRIEVVDISHTGGKQTRAGMVVFENENPVPEDYRVYALDDDMLESDALAGDDYAALAIFAQRRIKSGPPWPDLLLIDGGKGQLAAVHRVFAENKLDSELLLASIAKARTEDGRSDRRAGNVSDRIFLPGRSNPLNILPGSAELLFLQRIRDAAHDYVIGRHRKARAAAALNGELTRLSGVGPKLAKTLFDRYGSLENMSLADANELKTIPGIGPAKAQAIYSRLKALMGK